MEYMTTVPEESLILNTESSDLRSGSMNSTLKKNEFDATEGSSSTILGEGVTSSIPPYTSVELTETKPSPRLEAPVGSFDGCSPAETILRTSEPWYVLTVMALRPIYYLSFSDFVSKIGEKTISCLVFSRSLIGIEDCRTRIKF